MVFISQIECGLAWYVLLMKQYAASQWSKCWGLTRRATVMTHTVWYRNTYHARPHSICFSPQCQRQRKGFFFFLFFFWPRSWHKERSSVGYNFPNQISLLPKISVSDWLLQQETAATRILHRAKRPQSWTKYPGGNIIVLRQNIHIGICNDAVLEEAI